MNHEERKTFTFINNDKLCQIVRAAKSHIIYAAPSISESVAESLCEFTANNQNVALRIIIDADPDAFRLGFGEHAGLVLLTEKGIDIRRAEGLRIGIIAADENAWVYSPTPEIIFEQPTHLFNNAIQVSIDFAKQILFAVAPDMRITTDEDILDENFITTDLMPEIGIDKISETDLETIEIELKKNPPEKFDAARKVRVYKGVIQFVKLQLSGCRLGSLTVTIPEKLLDIISVSNTDERLKIKSTFRLIDEEADFSSKLKKIAEQVNDLRGEFLIPLGERYGSIIVVEKRQSFDEKVVSIQQQIKDLRKTIKESIEKEIQNGRQRLINIFLPIVVKNLPIELHPILLWENVEQKSVQYIEAILNKIIPDTSEMIRGINLVCDYKDVTFEMLNDSDFTNLIGQFLPKEKFPKLYSEEKVIGKKIIQKELS